MKKISKLFMGFSIPTISLCFVPLTSCNKDAINVKIEKGDHVTLAEIQGEPRINQEFKIKCTLGDAGWKKLSSSGTYIKVGSDKLIKDRHYSIDTDTIWIYSNVIKSNDITVHLEAEGTITRIDYGWSSSCKKVHSDYALFAVPGQTLTTDDLKITGQFGDGSRDIDCGTETGQYQIYTRQVEKGEITDITSDFKANGYTFTTDQAAEGPNQVRLGYKFTDGLGFEAEHDMLIMCGNVSKSLKFNMTQKEVVAKDKLELQWTVDEHTYSLANLMIVEGEKTTAKDTKIIYEEDKCYLQAGEETGTVQIKATSKFNTAVSDTIDITVKAVE